MIEPDICTSLICPGPPNKHCPKCSHAIFFGEGTDVNGKVWRWEFNPMFGPTFLNIKKKPLKRQPISENHPAWKPFEKWESAHNNVLQRSEKGGV